MCRIMHYNFKKYFKKKSKVNSVLVGFFKQILVARN